MRDTIFTFLYSMVLLAVLSSSALAAEPIKSSRPAIARQSTAADINETFELLEQEVLAEEPAVEQPSRQTRAEVTPSATPPLDSRAELQLVARYKRIIRNAIAQNWIPTGSGRADGPVVIHVRLAPNGTIISSAIGKSSGTPAFDHAALQAVERTERFEELQDLPVAVYERNFRDLDLLLRPEDLLQ